MRTVAGAHQNCHWSPEWLLQGSLPGPNRLECGKGDPTPGPMVGLGRDANCYWEASRMCREATGMQWGRRAGGWGEHEAMARMPEHRLAHTTSAGLRIQALRNCTCSLMSCVA